MLEWQGMNRAEGFNLRWKCSGHFFNRIQLGKENEACFFYYFV